MNDSAARSPLLEGLNPEQARAVTHRGGPCLVLAGAGSGKTRVITHRVAWLLAEQALPASSVCAVTFTNKAAAEMRSRIDALTGGPDDDLWVLTFHALGLRLLRDAAGAAGTPRPGFFVVDRGEALSIWRGCQAAARIDVAEFPPAQLFEACSRAVNRLEDPRGWDDEGRSSVERRAGRVYGPYRAELARRNAVDFDDLLAMPLRLIVDGAYRPAPERFRHLLVDEYQDTNRLQYRLLRTLLSPGAELVAVGDEDQAIYRWRGADIANVLDFQRDFPGAEIVRLEQNYRSTRPVLAAAGSLVGHNRERLGKQLWTENPGQEIPRFMLCATDRSEAIWVARQLGEAMREGVSAGDLAVLYRTNAQSRVFEEELAGRGVPFRVVGGPTFFRRTEVKDLLAWLRLAVADDATALARAAATPRRGVGPAAIAALGRGGNPVVSMLAAAAEEDAVAALRALGCKGRAAAGAAELARAIATLRSELEGTSPTDMVELALRTSGYAEHLRRAKDGEERRANLDELVASAAELGDEPGDEPLVRFLDRAALVSDADSTRGAVGVSLMTVHAAKGLEFDTVLVAGLEEGLFPHASAVQDGHVEEERRLAYVAMTRARRVLRLSAARMRRVRGRERFQEVSRFVAEIDPRHLRRDEEPAVTAAAAETARRSRSEHGGRGASRGGARATTRTRSRHATRAPVDPGARGSGAPAPLEALVPGAPVFHPMFGPGRITAAEGHGDKLKLTVDFARAGTKQLIAKFAKLQRLAS